MALFRFHWRTACSPAALVLLLAGAQSLTACGKPPETYNNASGGEVAVIGHGGAGFRSRVNSLPANSMRSISRAVYGLGADGVEVDLQISADGTPVLFHDERMDDSTDCTGCLLTLSDAQIKACRYHTSFVAPTGVPERVVFLRELLQKLQDEPPPPLVFLDVKTYGCGTVNPRDYEEKLVEGVTALIREHRAEAWVVVQSGSASFLRAFRRRDLSLQLYFDGDDAVTAVRFALDYNLNGLVFPVDAVSRGEVRVAQQAGLPVMVYDVRSRLSALDALALQPDAVATDDVLLVRDLLGK